ncbi:hypothetical protein SCHPADRAFT_854361 [Schizopora paradoxa]|uniref:Mid2 domain-containing protein n=1 Tax=Schizopora paradoxa TaxID=27342 RepID=A0A0H2S5A6_9AGAM|nr:hypothetical protein SCHPADRAFT_854361 [Schizopora paradoxa]
MGRYADLALVLALSACFRTSVGQAFQWKFNTNSFSTTLTECQSYPVLVQNRSNTNTSALGTPPYYMIAFKPSGIPTTSFIGSDPTNLTWTVNQAEGSNLLLSVVDAAGSSGGQPPNLFSVGAGSTTSCLPPPPSENITVVPNITKTVTTCQAMGFQIEGGKKPYNLTLVAPNSTVLTNVTMGPTDDVFTYIDRADPNSGLMAAVVDANGVWANSSELFATTGPVVTDNSCVGLVSSSGNSSSVNLHPKQPSSGNGGKIAAAVVVPIIVIALLAGVGFWLWRRRRSQLMREPEPAFLPDAWVGPTGPTIGEEASTTYGPYSDSPRHPDSKMARYRDSASQLGSGSGSGGGSVSQIGMALLSPRPGGSSASYHDGMSSSGSASGARSPLSGADGKGAQLYGSRGPRLPPGVPGNWEIQREGDLVIQHRDGGAVQEIPPPYVDRGNGAGPSGSGSGDNQNAEASGSGLQS